MNEDENELKYKIQIIEMHNGKKKFVPQYKSSLISGFTIIPVFENFIENKEIVKFDTHEKALNYIQDYAFKNEIRSVEEELFSVEQLLNKKGYFNV